MLDVALLGTGGMMPLPNRYLTSLLLRLNGSMLLLDCGEGTQITMKELGWGFKSVDIICITHYHADHISGLPGLLLTIGNSDRREPVVIIGPKGLKKVYEGLSIICPELPFKVELMEIEPGEDITVGQYNISTIKLNHKIPCIGYSFKVHRVGKFNVEKALALGLPKQLWSVIQKQGQVEYDGNIYTSDMVLGEDRKGLKVTYATDSRPVDNMAEFAKDSDLFICEGMYGENEKKDKAKEYKHMLFSEAANIAKSANVKEMWLTHFSPAMPFPENFIKNATSIFENTVIGKDRKTTTLLFEKE